MQINIRGVNKGEECLDAFTLPTFNCYIDSLGTLLWQLTICNISLIYAAGH